MNKPSTAFEVTDEDLSTVLSNLGLSLGESATTTLFNLHIVPHYGPGGRIEKAALQGNDMDKQTTYAHQEIEAILKEAGII